MAQWNELDLRGDPDEARFEGDPGELVDALGFLLRLIDRPAWHGHAACREHPEVSWFTSRGGHAAPPRTSASTASSVTSA